MRERRKDRKGAKVSISSAVIEITQFSEEVPTFTMAEFGICKLLFMQGIVLYKNKSH